MHAQNFVVNHRGDVEIVEHLCAMLPCVCVAVLALAFFVEPVYLSDLSALVVAPQQSDVGGVPVAALSVFAVA